MSAYPSVVVVYKPTAMQVYTIPNLQPNHLPATDFQPCIAFVMLIHPIVEALTGFRGGGDACKDTALVDWAYPQVYTLPKGLYPNLGCTPHPTPFSGTIMPTKPVAVSCKRSLARFPASQNTQRPQVWISESEIPFLQEYGCPRMVLCGMCAESTRGQSP